MKVAHKRGEAGGGLTEFFFEGERQKGVKSIFQAGADTLGDIMLLNK